jgi:hypothetical protein
MQSAKPKKKSLAKELFWLVWWNLLAYLAITALVGNQFNVQGVYGQL